MEIDITVSNWEAYNPRGDSKCPSWLRFENNFFFSQSMFNLSNDEKMVWLFILCAASQKNSSHIALDFDFIAHHSHVSINVIKTAIEKLEQKQCITTKVIEPVRDSHGSVRDSHEHLRDSPATYERTNERTRSKSVDQNKFDLLSLYESYPRKIGKQNGIKKLKTVVKDNQTFDKLKAAITNYCKYCSNQKLESKYIKHFSTFVNSWEEWVDPANGSCAINNKTQNWILEA